MSHCYNIQNTYKRYLFSLFAPKIRMCVRSIFYYIVSASKGLVQEIVILVFHRCLYNKQKIAWPLGACPILTTCSSRASGDSTRTSRTSRKTMVTSGSICSSRVMVFFSGIK